VCSVKYEAMDVLLLCVCACSVLGVEREVCAMCGSKFSLQRSGREWQHVRHKGKSSAGVRRTDDAWRRVQQEPKRLQSPQRAPKMT
jgi:hypothetical protein